MGDDLNANNSYYFAPLKPACLAPAQKECILWVAMTLPEQAGKGRLLGHNAEILRAQTDFTGRARCHQSR
jgi:hypothetical protein